MKTKTLELIKSYIVDIAYISHINKDVEFLDQGDVKKEFQTILDLANDIRELSDPD